LFLAPCLPFLYTPFTLTASCSLAPILPYLLSFRTVSPKNSLKLSFQAVFMLLAYVNRFSAIGASAEVSAAGTVN
jgi:hypothetical protein